ncbi:Ribonuclease H domain [Sesbania bispinosa]|nr:Ribonuclease H domain [Sesbania bispinosa]
MAQEVKGRERPICYLSRVLKDVETRYPKQERYCLAFAYAAQKYMHYFQAHTVEVMCKSEGIKCLLQSPSLTGRMSRCALMMSEYDIQLIHPTKLKSQALTDMLAICSSGEDEDVMEELRGEMPSINACKKQEAKWWTLRFDGTPAHPCGGARVILEQEGGKVLVFSYQLRFPCTNNEAEYEALVLGLRMAGELGVRRLRIKGDLNLVIKQLKGQYGAKEESLAMYKEEALKWIVTFEEVEASHVPRVDNKHADVLATIGSRESRDEGEQIVIFKRSTNPSWTIEPFKGKADDWRRLVIEKLIRRVSSKVDKEYKELKGILYKRSAEGLLMKCVPEREGVQKAKNLHHATCGQDGPTLNRRMQRIYWPSMKTQCELIQEACEQCKDAKEWLAVNVVEGDWRKPLKEYLKAGVLPPEPREAEKIKKKYERYFLERGELFKRSFVARMVLGGGIPREAAAEGLEEDRNRAEEELIRHHRWLTLAYEKVVKPRMFHEGELVLKATDAVMRKQHTSKWAPNWEGPYIVKDAHESGYCTLLDPEDGRVIGSVNFKYVKKYYA